MRRNNRGRRFDDEPKLNIKKVVATVLAFLVIVMVISSLVIVINKKSKEQEILPETIHYFAAYDNSKWTVLKSNGDTISDISYDEMIVIPDKTKDVFIVTYDVDYTNETYKTKAVNSSNQQLFSGFENVSAIINYKTVDETWYDTDVLAFQKDGKYGLIDYSGKQVLAPEYDDITALQGITQTVVLQKDGKYGLFNDISKTKILDTEYTSIKAFGSSYSDGYIVMNSDGKYGLVGGEGNVILECKYDGVNNVSGSGMYVVLEGGKTEIISKDGEVILNAGFDEVVSIDGDNIVVKNVGKYGVINTSGNVVIDTAFDTMEPCIYGLYIVSTAGKYGVIDLNKDIRVEIKYTDIEYRSDITALICENEDYTTDVYTRDLNLVFTGTISKVDSTNGYIRARVDGDYKYYNLQYQEISSQEALKNNTLFLVKENGKYGYVNEKNEKIVECIYDDAMEQNEYGFAAIKLNGRWGVIKRDGTVILEPSILLDNNLIIDFIGQWHLNENAELHAYTK